MIIATVDSRGKDKLEYCALEKNDPKDDEIEVKTKFCGICRSDIAIYAGYADPMPLGYFGHEGVGTVTEVGKKIKNIKKGDFVATTSDPAYGTYYNAKESEFVKIPKLSPKYIIEPIACAINIIDKSIYSYPSTGQNKIVIFGTGFMSMIIGQYCKKIKKKLIIIGNSHKEKWKEIGYELTSYNEIKNKKFPIVIDLSSKAETFDKMTNITEVEGLIVMAATPFTPITTNFFNNSWNCHNLIFPSPRNANFKKIMESTVSFIEEDFIQPKKLWTKGYEYNNILQGFKDGRNRTKDYIRGYLKYES